MLSEGKQGGGKASGKNDISERESSLAQLLSICAADSQTAGGARVEMRD